MAVEEQSRIRAEATVEAVDDPNTSIIKSVRGFDPALVKNADGDYSLTLEEPADGAALIFEVGAQPDAAGTAVQVNVLFPGTDEVQIQTFDENFLALNVPFSVRVYEIING